MRRICSITLTLLAFGAGSLQVPLSVRADEPKRLPEPSGLAAVAAIENALVAAIAEAEKSVVAIARVGQSLAQMEMRGDVFGQSTFQRPSSPDEPDFIPNDYATGVIIDAGGLILTAQHVLRDGSSYYVTTADRRVYLAKVVAADPRGDLAVLRIDARNLTPIKMGDASLLRKGQIVVALGNPYAIARDGQVSASWGIVSNLARKDGPLAPKNSGINGKPTLHQNGSLIQTDAKLNLGTSGGALINLSGEMVGLTVALSATLGYEQAAGYALPVDAPFKRALERLKQGREAEYGFLGVNIDNLAAGDRVGIHSGVGVRRVVAGTPADHIGLRSNDIVTHVGPREIHDADEFMLAVGSMPAGDQVELTWYRDAQVITRSIELAKYPVPGQKIVTTLEPQWRGMRVDYVTMAANLAEREVLARGELRGSVLVTEVESNSPAWQVGLRPDMLISHVAGKSIRSPKEFHQATSGQAGPVELQVVLANGDQEEWTVADPQ